MDKATLTLSSYNPYSNGSLLVFADGERWLERNELEYEYSNDDRIHIVIEDETLTGIAWKFWKGVVADSPKYWWILADVNDIENPLEIEYLIGQNIIVPDILKLKLIDLQK